MFGRRRKRWRRRRSIRRRGNRRNRPENHRHLRLQRRHLLPQLRIRRFFNHQSRVEFINTRPQLRIIGRQTRIQASFDNGACRLDKRRRTKLELQPAFKVDAKMQLGIITRKVHTCWALYSIRINESGSGGHDQHKNEE